MTNTGKMLIIGLLVIDAGVAGYLLFPKEDRRPAVTGTVIGSGSDSAAVGDSRVGQTHATAGAAVRTSPDDDGGADKLGAVKPVAPVAPVAPASTTTGAVTTATTIAPAVTAPAAPQAATRSRSATRTAIAATEVQPSARTKSKPALHAEQTRGRKNDDPRHGGSKQVSAALTAQLVRESAKPDPSLPLPPASSGLRSSGRSSNPVASAMTDQLVRESSKVNLSSPAQSYKH